MKCDIKVDLKFSPEDMALAQATFDAYAKKQGWVDPPQFRNQQSTVCWGISADHIDEMLAAMFATESKSKQLTEAVKRCHELGASKEEIAKAVFG